MKYIEDYLAEQMKIKVLGELETIDEETEPCVVVGKRLVIDGVESDIVVWHADCSIHHNYIVAIHTWNNTGGNKFSLDFVRQVSTIDSFNKFIIENIGNDLEEGSYTLAIK